MTNITFNGKTYNSLNEMSANERQAYEQMMNILVDKNGNGIPDFLEGDMVQNVMKAHSANIGVDGNASQTINDLSPETRENVRTALKILARLGILPRDIPASLYEPTPAISREPQFVSREFNPTIQEEKSNTSLIVVLVSLIALLCIGVAVALVFLFPG